MLLTETCYYIENQGFGGATNRDMSLTETCFHSRLYGRCTLEIWALIGQGLKGNSVMVMQDSFIVSQNLMTLISTNLLLNSTLGISQILVIVLKNHSYEICSNEIRIRRELPVVGIT